MSVSMLSGSRPSLLAQSSLRFVGIHVPIHIEGVAMAYMAVDCAGLI